MKRIWVISLAVALLFAAVARSDDFKIVVNRDNPASSITRAELERMFLKKQKTWPDGTAVQPVDLPEDQPARTAMSEAVHHRTLAAVRSYWLQVVFSGREVPPIQKRSDAEVVEFVRTNKGAVGYVSNAANVDAVKVVTIR